MSIIESCQILLPKHENTVAAGRFLSKSLYRMPLTILLSGELGNGKTTFFQGLAEGLGVRGHVTSPTFPIEQRYVTEHWGDLLHIDLYRLLPASAREIVATTDDHSGIRCIEWAQRLDVDLEQWFPHSIDILFSEDASTRAGGRNGRTLEATFRDIRLPPPTDIEGWRKEVMLPPWIVAHCHAVADLSRTFAGALRKHGIPVRTEALTAAGELHDLLRIVDLRPEAAPKGSPTPSSEEQACWEKWQTLFADLSHEEAVATFLRERGYAELGDIVAVHGLKLPSPLRATTEQKLLFYTDKRVKEDKVVSLEERFRDFRERYGKGKESDRSRVWYEEAQKLEKELFPNGVPL